MKEADPETGGGTMEIPANLAEWIEMLIRISFTAPGAMAAGTRVRKKESEAGDIHPDGALATVLASVPLDGEVFGYLVAWDDLPADSPTAFVVSLKLEAV